jgi:hypothetical protein
MSEFIAIIKTTRMGETAIALHLKGETLKFPTVAQAEKMLRRGDAGPFIHAPSLRIERKNVERENGSVAIEYHLSGGQAPYVTLSELLTDHAYALGLAAGAKGGVR